MRNVRFYSVKMTALVLALASVLAVQAVSAPAAAADCPTGTATDMGGLTPLPPQQFELAELQQAANYILAFA